jgi:hypothetical protein
MWTGSVVAGSRAKGGGVVSVEGVVCRELEGGTLKSTRFAREYPGDERVG